MSISLCRYSGGKARGARSLIEHFTGDQIASYREPFFGAGSVGLNLLTTSTVANAWFNDCDPTVFCMWWAAAHHSEMLKAAVRAFVPGVSKFRRIKSQFLSGIVVPSSPAGIVQVAVDKIGIQQMSYSGLGPMAGGPLGGWSQVNGGIDSRWNAEKICRKIDLLAPHLRRAMITKLDFSVMLGEGARSLIYLDPPYWKVGDGLYQHSMSEVDHHRLKTSLRHSDHDWWLSYNDVPEIRELYSFASIERIDATYSTSKRRTHELLISSPNRNRTIVGYHPATLAA